ncbi:MAG: cobyric acid synthase [Desulfonauticus sp.]|nr:cobyric acid synthase [Desulfonauticus sp.]
MSYEHGGNIWQVARDLGCSPYEVIDFSASLNPFGPPVWFNQAWIKGLSAARHYPDPYYLALRQQAASFYKVQVENVWPLNGASEIFPVLVDKRFSQCIVFPPCFSDYYLYSKQLGLPVKEISLLASDFDYDFDLLGEYLDKPSLVFLGYPNNPCGKLFDFTKLRQICQHYPDSLFVVDCAFWDFLEPSKRFDLEILPNLLYLFSLTKILSLPGVRIGFVVGAKEQIQYWRKKIACWSVNSLAEQVAKIFFQDVRFCKESRVKIKANKIELLHNLSQLNIEILPSEANFILIKTPYAQKLCTYLKKRKILLRSCANFSELGDNFLRLSVRTKQEQNLLFEHWHNFLAQKTKFISKNRTKKGCLMIQGTSSNVGKSFLVCALARILARRGFKVAPFKAQNMALNSFVTKDGLEIGMAQALQAKACRLDPDVRMNPVLLKPSSNLGAQVIVKGKPIGHMNVEEYIAYKPQAWEVVKECLCSLKQEFDLILIEGAGSPVEVNLKNHDIVNMKVAKFANAPVLLVGDINLGGVFAAFWGTFSLLEPEEKDLIWGFIINKFRGQKKLLVSGCEFLSTLTSKPVLGIIPYAELNLPEEDSVSLKTQKESSLKGEIKIGVIDLPHISNFTDFDPLKIEPDVALVFIKSLEQLQSSCWDVLILPGSKNVFADLKFLFTKGLAQEIAKLVKNNKCEVIGICGGYQMLGLEVQDEQQIEGRGHLPGLGLLPITTWFQKEKVMLQTEATFLPWHIQVVGYEIHHGRTKTLGNTIPLISSKQGEVIGVGLPGGRIWGTYLHGLFDNDQFRHFWLNSIRQQKGLPKLSCRPNYDISQALDELADLVEENLDVERVLQALL